MENPRTLHFLEARRSLDELRRNSSIYRHERLIDSIRTKARKGDFSLTDIGTSEDELEKLLVKGSKVTARMWLDELRSDSSIERHEALIDCIREEAISGNFSLADIGTSEDELASFTQAST